MTLRDELEVIGFGLATMAIAFAGTMLALFTLIPLGFYTEPAASLGPVWAGLLPAAAVALFTGLLHRHLRARLHPIPITLAAFIGGVLSFPLFRPFGLLSILLLAALVVYPVTLIVGFSLDRPRLTASEVALHAVTSFSLYSVFALSELAVAIKWVDTTGCDGCDPMDSLISAVVLFALGLSVAIGAALRYGPLWARPRPPSPRGTSGR